MKKNILLFLFTLLIIFLLIEVFVRKFYPQDLQRFWVTNEKESGLQINKKNFVHNMHRFKSYKAKYTFGEFHNRITNFQNDNDQKNKILILGDSFTFGWLIEDEKTFVHKLQVENPDYDLINVAVGGWGTAHYTLFSEIFCNNIKPLKIFVFLNTDDPHRGYKSKIYSDDYNELKIVKKDFNIIDAPSYFDKNIPFYKFMKSHSHFFLLLRNVVYDFIVEPTFNPWSAARYWPRPNSDFDLNVSKKVSEYNKKIFLRLSKISKKCNSELYVFNIMWADLDKMKNTNPNKFFLKSAKKFFENANINYYENSNNMKKVYNNPMKYIINIDFHPNIDGADMIYKNFRNEFNKALSN